MTHLLDTDTCIGVLRQRPGMVQRLSSIAPTDCAVSMVTVYDLLIAGQSLASGLTLVTNNVQEFQRVAGLKLESWP